MKLKNWLMAIVMAVVALSFVSCSKEGGNNRKIVGQWKMVDEKVFIDDQEIVLETGSALLLYNNNETDIFNYFDDYYEDDWFVPIGLTFFEGGTMDYTIVTGSYKVEKDKVICNVYGEDIIFHIVGEYLVRYDEAPITGYIIAEDTDPDIIYENKLDGKNRTYKYAQYYSKVN